MIKKGTTQHIPSSGDAGYRFMPSDWNQQADLFWVCFMKGLIVFAAVFGSMGAFLSGFQVECNKGVVFFLLLLVSVVLTMLHYSKRMFRIIYFLTFGVFLLSVLFLYSAARTGFQFLLARIQQEYCAYFELSNYRAIVIPNNRNMASVEIALIFIGFLLLIFTNIAVSEYMSLPLIFLFTFPIAQLGLYIGKTGHPVYYLFLLFSYLATAFLRAGNHYTIPYNDEDRCKITMEETKEGVSYSYRVSAPVMFQQILLILGVALLAALIGIPFFQVSFNSNSAGLRKASDNFVKAFVAQGFRGLRGGSSTGGISMGKLDGIGDNSSSGKTDLLVTMPLLHEGSLYLKGFTGGNYKNKNWSMTELPNYQGEDSLTENERNQRDTLLAMFEGVLLQSLGNQPEIITIENKDANGDCVFLPYYPDLVDMTKLVDTLSLEIYQKIIYGKQPKNTPVTMKFYPQLNDVRRRLKLGENFDTEMGAIFNNDTQLIDYRSILRSYYTNIPPELNSYLDSLHPEIGTGSDTEEQVEQIRIYLEKTCTYSLSPGTTPRNEDLVRYFLEKNKKGYCSHFASAATLLLRSYGIPARYVEGYVIHPDDMMAGETIPGRDGYAGNMVRVKVPDGNAHAWVEVFHEEFGWLPYEVTPPSNEDEEANAPGSIFDIFGSLLPEKAKDTDPNLDKPTGFLGKILNGFSDLLRIPSILGALLLFVILMLAVWAGFVFLPGLVRFLKRRLKYELGDYFPMLGFYYGRICSRLHDKRLSSAPYLSPQELLETLQKNPAIFAERHDLFSGISESIRLFENCAYSAQKISKDQARHLLHEFKGIEWLLKKWD